MPQGKAGNYSRRRNWRLVFFTVISNGAFARQAPPKTQLQAEFLGVNHWPAYWVCLFIQLDGHKILGRKARRYPNTKLSRRAVAITGVVRIATQHKRITIAQAFGQRVPVGDESSTHALPLPAGVYRKRRQGYHGSATHKRPGEQDMPNDLCADHRHQRKLRHKGLAAAQCDNQILLIAIAVLCAGKGCLHQVVYGWVVGCGLLPYRNLHFGWF